MRLTGSRPLTHSLSELLELLSRAVGVDVPGDVARCAEELEHHYVQARYPDEYRRWEGERAVECMESLWRHVEGLGLVG